MENLCYGVCTHNHSGDALILAGAVHNVKLAHPDIRFSFNGFAPGIVENNQDFCHDEPDVVLPRITYGSIWAEQRAMNGNLVEGFTQELCRAMNIPLVPYATRIPRLCLTEAEKRKGYKYNGFVLLNANSQKCTVSKAYPHWQQVVDILAGNGVKVAQVGSREERNVSPSLRGVKDLRGRTENVREFLSSVYGCACCLTPPSFMMNAAAAIGKKCVVVCGSRELPELSGYPSCEYIETESCGFGTSQHACCIALRWEGRRACTSPVEIRGQKYSSCMASIAPERIAEAVMAML